MRWLHSKFRQGTFMCIRSFMPVTTFFRLPFYRISYHQQQLNVWVYMSYSIRRRPQQLLATWDILGRVFFTGSVPNVHRISVTWNREAVQVLIMCMWIIHSHFMYEITILWIHRTRSGNVPPSPDNSNKSRKKCFPSRCSNMMTNLWKFEVN